MNGDIIKAKSAMNSCPLAAPSYSGFFPFLFSLSGGLFLLYREILEYFTITLQCHRIIVRDVGFDPRTDEWQSSALPICKLSVQSPHLIIRNLCYHSIFKHSISQTSVIKTVALGLILRLKILRPN